MENNETQKYERARKRVEEIKGFYWHLAIYIVINLLLVLISMGLFSGNWFDLHPPSWSYFTTPFFWGIGLFFHGLHVFQHKMRFFRDWEERKINEYMQKDEEEFKNTHWD